MTFSQWWNTNSTTKRFRGIMGQPRCILADLLSSFSSGETPNSRIYASLWESAGRGFSALQMII